MIKKVALITMLCFSFAAMSQGSILTADKLKDGLAEFLVEKKQIKVMANNTQFGKINLSGVHHKLVSTLPKSGIYSFNNGLPSGLCYFVIVQNNNYEILDVSTIRGLNDALKKVLRFSDKKNFCKEIITDYTFRLINTHYNINDNPRTYKTDHCEWLKENESTYNVQSLGLKLAEYLVEQEEMTSIDAYYEKKDHLLLERIGKYHGLPNENKKMNCDLYAFTNRYHPQQNVRFVIVNEDWFEILELEKDQLEQNINQIIDFGERQNTCYLETNDRIKNLIERIYTTSCFDNFLKTLP